MKALARRLHIHVSAPTRRAVIGLLAFPVSMLPFVAYAQLTPQGALLSAIIHEALLPPKLPQYSPATVASMRAEQYRATA